MFGQPDLNGAQLSYLFDLLALNAMAMDMKHIFSLLRLFIFFSQLEVSDGTAIDSQKDAPESW